MSKILHFLRKATPRPAREIYHKILARLAALFYGFPSRHLVVIGVTGTDGKTTTCKLITSILEEAGQKVGVITTVDYKIGEKILPNRSRLTMPGRFKMQRFLYKMAQEGIKYAVIEVTSHGLAQHRGFLVDFDLALLTNLTHEHLDYHKTFKDYRDSKAKLFRYLKTSYKKRNIPKISILNKDDPSYEYFSKIPADLKINYGIKKKADLTASEIKLYPTSSHFKIKTSQRETEIKFPHPGLFNIYNVLAASALTSALKIPLSTIKKALESFEGVAGRLEKIEPPILSEKQNFSVIVDYAHTPESFEKIFNLFKPLVRGRLWVVFGSGGERDKAKRPLQGELAGKYADFVIITDEDPRFEDREKIIKEIAQGAKKANKVEKKNLFKIPDRQEAINFAIKKAQKDDLVLILGKGHEQSIIYGDKKIPWDDRQAAKKALEKRFKEK